MMNYYYGLSNMMGYGGFNIVGSVFWAILFIDSILLGFWLWKQITKK